jgi:adenylate cyclase
MDNLSRTGRIESTERLPLPQYVKRALVYMNGNLANRVTMAELASASAVPERTLFRHFRQFLGLSPLAYLHRLRLNAAKSMLSNTTNNAAIADIAISCGFTHLGRFAAEYRRLFGEAPSVTRQRVRAPAAEDRPGRAQASGAGENMCLATPSLGYVKPALLILPLHTETLRESLEARDLTERLAATLSHIRIASVVLDKSSHSTSMHAPRPGNAGTQYCLLGRLTQRDGRTRVIIRLVDVATNRNIWGDSFDGAVDYPFEMQDRVVDGVLCGAVSHIFATQIDRAHSKDPKDLVVHDLAMQALMLILRTDVPSARRAMGILNRAIELDPGNALPVALLACCHAQLFIYHGTPTPAVACDMALGLVARAGGLGSDDPLMTTARGAAASMAMQAEEGDALVTRALAMDPYSTWAWERRGHLRLIRREDPDEIIGDFVRALRLRVPGMPRSNCLLGIASAHFAAGRVTETDRWTRKALAENPDATWLYRWQALYGFKMGDRSRLLQAVQHLRRTLPEFTVSSLGLKSNADPRWLDELARAGVPL